MISIEVIREMHCYKKMNSTFEVCVADCIDICRDLVVREKLIKVLQDAEDIYSGEMYAYKDLNADERIIVELLKFIVDTEISRVTDTNMQVIDNCIEWLLAIQNNKVELSKEFIEQQVNKIFAKVNEEENSEQ